MEYNKFILSFFLIFSSWVYVGFSQNLGGNAGNGGPGPKMECVQKLLPCQPYLQSPSPSPTCCLPLKEMVMNETQCLCGVITNPDTLKSLNITKDDAVNLAKNCGANPDLSVCKNATSPAGSPATPTLSPPTANSTNSSSSRDNSTKKSAADGICHFGGSGFIAFFVALIVSAFLGLTDYSRVSNIKHNITL